MRVKIILIISLITAVSVGAVYWYSKQQVTPEDPQVAGVKKTLVGFSNAAMTADKQQICSYLAPQAISNYKKTVPKHLDIDFCDIFATVVAENINRLGTDTVEDNIEDSEISVKGDKATVTRYVNSKQYFTFKLQRVNNRWYIVP